RSRAERERLRCSAARQEPATAPPPQRGWWWRRSAGPARANGPDRWLAGPASTAPPGCAREASVAAAGHGGPASRRASRRRAAGAARPQHGHFWGVAPVVCGLAAVDGLQREGRPEDHRHARPRTQSGPPVPGEEPCDTDDEGLARGRAGLEKGCWPSGPMPVQPHCTVLTQDTDVHAASRQIDTAVTWVLLRLESPEVSSSSLVFSPLPAYHGGMWRRGPQ